MNKRYTSEKNTQILISLMKNHGIKKVVASPGSTNSRFVASIQSDPWFEIYSVVDERSAAYVACGMAAESGESVALSCTGATASRNYVPGLTEAYYRQLPVLAITSTQHTGKVGNYIPQVIDRSVQMNDIVKLSVDCPTIHDADDEWSCVVSLNKALLELKKDGGGPVHINLTTTYSRDLSVSELPEVRTMRRYTYGDVFPEMPQGKIGIVVGSHTTWSDALISAVERFCEKYHAIVFVDHTSGYKGKYHAMVNLVTAQTGYRAECATLDLAIHIGGVSGSYHSLGMKTVWRCNPDGVVRDTYHGLTNIFEMKEEDFFNEYAKKVIPSNQSQYDLLKEWKKEEADLYSRIPESLPFSNPWIAKVTAERIPENASIHFGILSSLRSWNFFYTADSVHGYSNVGGFGIDGGVSSMIGASLVHPDKLFFGSFGDLAFFYDMNSLGNRHIGNNIRIILINNGKGTEFRNYNHPANLLGEGTNEYIAAARHYGNQSKTLVKHYTEDLGFEYMQASNEEEYLALLDRFTTPELTEKPMIVEVFTNSEDESNALKIMNTLKASTKGAARQKAMDILGTDGVEAVRRMKRKLKL